MKTEKQKGLDILQIIEDTCTEDGINTEHLKDNLLEYITDLSKSAPKERETAVRFAEWMTENGWEFYAQYDNSPRLYKNNTGVKTMSELYDLFLSSESQTDKQQ